MKLTGKAKEDFLEYYNTSTIKYLLNNIDFEDLPIVVNQSIVVNWFDSVGIHINIFNLDFQCWWFYEIKFIPTKISQKELQRSRQEATEKAIEKANSIYNERFSK